MRPAAATGGSEAEVCDILERLRETPAIFADIAGSSAAELALQRKLRERYPDEIVRAAMRLHDLRQRARSKFTQAEKMWFDRVGLEQSTSESVSRHKAQRFSGVVDDLCCGIGGDSIALTEHCDVRSVDLRESMTRMTAWNAEVYGVGDRVHPFVADVTTQAERSPLVHFDPDRRAGTRRSTRLEDYSPPLEFMQQMATTAPGGAIKLSPASNFGGKFPDCEIELVSLQGECKEAIVWFGSLAGEYDWRATVLPSGLTICGNPLDDEAEVTPTAAYVYDPDPAVVRSGLLDVVACELGLSRLDDAEEYLTGDELVVSDFVTPFTVAAELSGGEKQVRRYFREHPFGHVEIKCRHVPVDADRLRKKLSLTGAEAATLIVARVAGRTRNLVCHRISRPPDGQIS